MSGKGVCCRSCTVLVKVPLSLLTVILLGSLVHRKSALAAGFPAPSFAAGRTFDVGMGVLSMVVGDFNGDGKPDLAVGQWVVLGNGDGTFQAAVNYGAGVGPRPVAVGDFNGDGKPDLAVADEAGVSVLLGKGDGTFQAPVSSGLGTFPRSVAVGDFDGDGRLDLAVATTSNSTNKVSVLLGRRDGTFHAAANYGAGTNPCSVAVGDFNGDGKPDLAVANLGLFGGNYTEGSVSVLLGNGDGTFQPAVNYTPGGNPSYVVAGDFNADGKLDLAVAAYSTNNVSLLLGRGDGTFLAAANFRTASNPSFLVVGDFNGDGKPDLATVNYSGVSVLLSKGDGSFQNAVSYGVGQGLDSLAVGDFDSDGKPDLAVAYAEGDAPSQYSKSYGRVAVFLGEGDGTPSTTARGRNLNPWWWVTSTAMANPTSSWPTRAPPRFLCCWAQEMVPSGLRSSTARERMLFRWQWATSTATASRTWLWQTMASRCLRARRPRFQSCWEMAMARSRPPSTTWREPNLLPCRWAILMAMASLTWSLPTLAPGIGIGALIPTAVSCCF